MSRHHCYSILQDICNRWIIIKRGVAPASSRRRRNAILRIALAGSTNNLKKRLALSYFPNGDPFLEEEMEIWVPEDQQVDRIVIVTVVADSFYQALFDSLVPVTNRNRWRGFYDGMSALILQDGFNGLGTELFKLHSAKVMRVGPPQSSEGESGPDNRDPSLDVEFHRTHGMTWVNTKPYPRVAILRMVSEAMRIYQVTHSELTSAKHNRTVQIGDVLDLAREPRALKDAVVFYKLVSGDLELDATQRMNMLMCRPELWSDLLPDHQQPLEHRFLAFAQIAQQASLLVVKLLGPRHRQPQATFRVDVAPDEEKVVVGHASCPHLHTPWSSQHVQAHLGPAVTQPIRDLRKAKRVHLACEATTTIDELESLHALLKRRLKTRGEQTWALELEQLNAEWVIDRIRSREMNIGWRCEKSDNIQKDPPSET